MVPHGWTAEKNLLSCEHVWIGIFLYILLQRSHGPCDWDRYNIGLSGLVPLGVHSSTGDVILRTGSELGRLQQHVLHLHLALVAK